ncbi:MAG TPA: DUF6438 domain-containing protein [Chitinophagaceae bacterium]|jgi:hypothetical protein
MQLKTLALFFLFSIIISCSSVKNEKVKTELHKIIITTGDCYGTCPSTITYIDDSLSFYFAGLEFAKRNNIPTGYFKGKISDTLWDLINAKTKSLKYQILDSVYNHSNDDQSLQIMFEDSSRAQKIISAQEASLPDTIRSFVYWVADLYKKISLNKIDSITFISQIPMSSFPHKLKPPPDIIKIMLPKNK